MRNQVFRAAQLHVVFDLPSPGFERVLQALDQLGGELTRNEAAAMMHLSEEAFSRKFKRVTGYRFRDLQVESKLRKSADLLTETTLTVARVAEIVGYSEPAKLQKAFRKAYGMSPLQFRRNRTTQTGSWAITRQ